MLLEEVGGSACAATRVLEEGQDPDHQNSVDYEPGPAASFVGRVWVPEVNSEMASTVETAVAVAVAAAAAGVVTFGSTVVVVGLRQILGAACIVLVSDSLEARGYAAATRRVVEASPAHPGSKLIPSCPELEAVKSFPCSMLQDASQHSARQRSTTQQMKMKMKKEEKEKKQKLRCSCCWLQRTASGHWSWTFWLI